MDKWEYKVIKYNAKYDSDSENKIKNSKNLEQLGLEGWELCGVVPIYVNGSNGSGYDLIFKRKIISPEPKQLSKDDIIKQILLYQ